MKIYFILNGCRESQGREEVILSEILKDFYGKAHKFTFIRQSDVTYIFLHCLVLLFMFINFYGIIPWNFLNNFHLFKQKKSITLNKPKKRESSLHLRAFKIRVFVVVIMFLWFSDPKDIFIKWKIFDFPSFSFLFPIPMILLTQKIKKKLIKVCCK